MPASRRSVLTRFLPHLRNGTWSVLEYVAYPVAMLLATPWLIAHLGSAQYGLWMLVNALAGLTGISGMGMGPATIHHVSIRHRGAASDDVPAVIRTALALALSGALAIGAAMALSAPWLAGHAFTAMGDPAEVARAIALAALLLCIYQVDAVFGSALKGLERFDLSAALEGCARLAVVATAVVTSRSGHLQTVLLGSAAVGLAGAAAKAWCVAGQVGGAVWWPELHRRLARELLHMGKWSWLQGVGAVLFQNGDRLLVATLLGSQSLAWYSVAIQLAQQVHAAPAAAMTFLFPMISRRFAGAAHGTATSLPGWAIGGNVACVAALAAPLALFAAPLLRIWVGADIAAHATAPLQWLTLAFFVLGLGIAPYYYLLGLGDARYLALNNLLGGAIGLATAAALIPTLGLTGTAMGRLVIGVIALAAYLRLADGRPAPARAAGI